jgi:hypothetical protein
MTPRILRCLVQLAVALAVLWSLATAALEAVDEAAATAQAEIEPAPVRDERLGWIVVRS